MEATVRSNSALENLFPIRAGYQWVYATSGDEGENGRLLVRAERTVATEGVLVTGGRRKTFHFEGEGIREGSSLGAAFVLRPPLEVGRTWRGTHGGTVEVTGVRVTARVPAGLYDGCISTVERRGGDVRLQVNTVYCPDVGIVSLEVFGGGRMERAELVSYGPPIDLGPDGLKAIPPRP
ncbi:MAG: hypothetical protein AAGA56_29200 [Myxococcota bacterium]